MDSSWGMISWRLSTTGRPCAPDRFCAGPISGASAGAVSKCCASSIRRRHVLSQQDLGRVCLQIVENRRGGDQIGPWRHRSFRTTGAIGTWQSRLQAKRKWARRGGSCRRRGDLPHSTCSIRPLRSVSFASCLPSCAACASQENDVKQDTSPEGNTT